jgi:hypothetical protein
MSGDAAFSEIYPQSKLFYALFSFIDLDQIWMAIYEIGIGGKFPLKPEQDSVTKQRMSSRL